MLCTPNPYSGRGAPVSGERLVGRNTIMKRIIDRVCSGAHCSIVGLPRMGKTSIAREVLAQVKNNSPNIFTGYLSLDAISGPVQAYYRIIQEISPPNGDELSINSLDHDTAYEKFLSTLRKKKSSGNESVIVIDEFDGIARKDFSDPLLFIARLREIANYHDHYGIVFIFVSRRSLDMIQGAVDCSTLAGLCEVFYLTPLNFDGINSLCLRSTISVDKNAIISLWKLCGGHPFLSEVIMCEAIDQKYSEISSEAIIEAQAKQSHEFINQYRILEKLFSHEGMFESLCEIIVGPQWRMIDVYSLTLLKQYGLLRVNDDNVYECMSTHLHDYLNLLSRTTPSWYLLGKAERLLRSLIKDKMQEVYGDEWIDILSKKHPKTQKICERFKQQRSKERRLFGEAASDSILDYAYIGDLKDIIFLEWDSYRIILSGSKKDWEAIFQSIMKVRNPMAHNRKIPDGYIRDADKSCSLLLKKITGKSN